MELVFFIIFLIVIVGLAVLFGIKGIFIVPTQTALIVERLGKFDRVLNAGFRFIIPFIEKVKYKHNLKERAIDISPQMCITIDNVRIEVDGIIYLKVVNPKKASYGINRYLYASKILAQTTMRSIIGKMNIEKTFAERELINAQVVKSVDEASEPWGIKVTRYEIQNIKVPDEILSMMEVHMEAERIKRADVAQSEGELQAQINHSIGVMEEEILISEAEKFRLVNEAEGKVKEIEVLAIATAYNINKIAEALNHENVDDALGMRLAEEYIIELRKMASEKTDLILPVDLGNYRSIMSSIKAMLENV